MKFLEKLKRKSKVKPTGKIIDMTKMGWGHNMSFSKHPEHGAYDWKAAIWYGSGVSVGDEIIWAAGEGGSHTVITALVTDCKWTGNVWDMYFIEGVVTHIGEHPVS